MAWPAGCPVVDSDSGEQRNFQRFSSSVYVSARRRDYDKLTREVSKGLLPTAPPSYSEAIKGSEANREGGVFGSVAEAVGRVVFVFSDLGG